jgi:hypothetical protein
MRRIYAIIAQIRIYCTGKSGQNCLRILLVGSGGEIFLDAVDFWVEWHWASRMAFDPAATMRAWSLLAAAGATGTVGALREATFV